MCMNITWLSVALKPATARHSRFEHWLLGQRLANEGVYTVVTMVTPTWQCNNAIEAVNCYNVIQ